MAMYDSSESTPETQPEVRVWQAVLLQTIEEWQSGPLRLRRQAEAFLFENDIDFPEVCSRAGMNPSRLRGQLKKLRGQPVRVEHPVAA